MFAETKMCTAACCAGTCVYACFLPCSDSTLRTLAASVNPVTSKFVLEPVIEYDEAAVSVDLS